MSQAIYQTNKDIPQEMILGNLLFTNLCDMKMSENELLNIFKSNNIPLNYVRKISGADAYRRATASVKNDSIIITEASGDKRKAKLEVDEVRCDNDSIKRIIGIKRVDQTNEDIAYDSIIEVVFLRDTNSIGAIIAVPTSDTNYRTYQDIADTITDRYNDWSVYHNKDTIKNVINRIIYDTHPINLMPTGLCKFTPASSSTLLYNLKNALQEMSAYRLNHNSHGNIMEIIPVIDTDEQRNLVQENCSAEITEECLELVMDLKDIIANKKTLTTRAATGYVEKFRLLKEKTQDYENLLNVYMEAIHAQIANALQLVKDNS